MNLFNLAGKTALITGCDKGIGQAMAFGLAEAGADIIGITRSGDAEQTATGVNGFERNFSCYRADLAERDEIYAVLQQITTHHNRLDILVNNAGMILRQPAAEHTDDYWDKVLSVNLDAQFILTREVGKEMIRAGSGKIIFTCSLLSFQGGINVPGYTASKSAIAGLVRAFCNEWAGKGINVNGIAPGYIATNNTEALRNDEVRSRSILERIPAGRWGTPDDFKGPAIFLASSASDYVNGEVLMVDGGWMAR